MDVNTLPAFLCYFWVVHIQKKLGMLQTNSFFIKERQFKAASSQHTKQYIHCYLLMSYKINGRMALVGSWNIDRGQYNCPLTFNAYALIFKALVATSLVSFINILTTFQ